MHIAILGGTGDIGEGLALRWASTTSHHLTIGSRDADRATTAATEYEETLSAHGVEASIDAADNSTAAAGADMVVLAVPPYHVSDTVDAVADTLASDAIVLSPAVGMQSDADGMHYHRPGAGSVTAVAAEAAPDSNPVVGAFHSISAHALADLDRDLSADILVVGNDTDAKATVTDLIEVIDGLRAFDAGPLGNATEVESLTPLLINLGRYNDDLQDTGVTFQ